jgi:hypothetical protein
MAKHTFRRRNPSRSTGEIQTILEMGAGATVGAVASRVVPQLLFSDVNTGALGYAGNIGIVALAYYFLPYGTFSLGVISGGIAATLMRILNDNFMPGMGLGAYWPSYFAVPTVSNAIGQTLNSPYPARVA